MHERNSNQVVVVDLNMPFWSVVRLMVKWAFASIPAAFIIGVAYYIFAAVFGGLFAGLYWGLR